MNALVIAITLSLFLLFYWRYRIRRTYIENMRHLETLTYENTIADKDKQLRALEENNAYLARIIHKYRKTIPALELAVLELYKSENITDMANLRLKSDSLKMQLEELQDERNNLLDNYQKETIATPHLGLPAIDAMIALMEKRASQFGISVITTISSKINNLIAASVKESDLLHLLGDLIENSINATSVVGSDRKAILIHFGVLNDCLLLEVSDSGNAFDVQTYQHFGNKPFSSHTEDGGSGTGLMDIWEIKKNYKISLYIYEYAPGSNSYSKKISFLFDRKNHFLLKTYREPEIKATLIRGDLHVFSYENT